MLCIYWSVLSLCMCYEAGIDCWSHGQVTSTDETGQVRLYSPTVIREMQKHLNSTHTDLGAPLENKVPTAYKTLLYQ